MKDTSQMPLVSILSVNWNQPEHTLEMLRSISSMDYENYEVILVDNGSEPGQSDLFKSKFPNLKLIRSEKNLGFSGGNNLGLPHCKGKYVLLLNNDTVAPNHLLSRLVKAMEDDHACAAVSPKIYFFYRPNILQYAGTTAIHPITGRGKKYGYGEIDTGLFDRSVITAYPNGACMLLRTDILRQLGGLPEDYFLYYEEHDLSEQLKRKGYHIRYEASTFIHHKVSASSGGATNPVKTYYLFRNRLLFVRRNVNGLMRILALAHGLLITFPVHFLRHLVNGRWKHLQALSSGLIWHFHSPDKQWN
jgi:GT2 family glycosyltransferase